MPLKFKERCCDLCDSDDKEFAFSYRKGKFKLFRCLNCGFYYLNPMPIIDKRAIEHTYGAQSTYSFNPVIKREVVDPVIRMRLSIEFNCLTEYIKTGRLLEVGCGEGDALIYAKELGFSAMGIEFTPRYAKYCKDVLNLDVSQGTLVEQQFEENSFDVIMYLMVLEHTPSPRTEVDEIKRILKPGGLLYLNIPNDGGLEVRLERRWNLLRQRLGWKRDLDESDPYWTPHHLVGFSKKSIEFLAHEFGFEIEHIRSYSSPEHHAPITMKLLWPYHRLLLGSKLRVVLRRTDLAKKIFNFV